MSGAAGISAAKNRRSKTEPNQKQLPPPISCGKNNSCAVPNKSINNNTPQTQTILVDPNSFQILGPMAPVQILKVHEQRLNRVDERLKQLANQTVSVPTQQLSLQVAEISASDETELDELFGRLEQTESKIGMLEEVIMTLQNKLTIAQNFAMETNLSMSALTKKFDQLQTFVNAQQAAANNNVVDITQVSCSSATVSQCVSPTNEPEEVSLTTTTLSEVIIA